ncbi:hypothetical protein A8924_0604 [Saccharopolyspora erythraea NRRL 2338]|uniref:Possible lipoprotein n=2 Tax=Saccharopolyspora erythraea TaxID=1836 RepID=A4F693_SACEN|nr:hypothetical protein N599_01090 [Saccharopolyspora erythraea D]PFG93369.1 hypothetical protein A8924_0604 [Saccharopolyspora erythraea NRRL 2338]CAL99567.1 possible lipoprotein [Saccharopolyspora erythraea NRRL 2338]
MNRTKRAVTGLAAATASLVIAATPALSAPQAPQVDPGITLGYTVVDARSGETTLQSNEHEQFRSASVVKLLIALDYLEGLEPGAEIPAEDEALLQPMLRSSNDAAASTFWVRGGQKAIVERMADKLDLDDTRPPAKEGMWGYTALSASDVAKTYRYVLDDTEPEVRDFIMGNLRKHTTCADDGFDQSFGLAGAPGADAVKQGWSGFGAAPEPGEECRDSSDDPAATARVLNSPEVARARQIAPGEDPDDAPEIDLKRPAMHTTGTVDDGDKIVVLLTLEPEKTDWQTAAKRTTQIAKALALA